MIADDKTTVFLSFIWSGCMVNDFSPVFQLVSMIGPYFANTSEVILIDGSKKEGMNFIHNLPVDYEQNS